MEELAWIGAAVAGLLLLTAAVWAWWSHRAQLIDMQRRLTWSEKSRFALERHARDVDLRLAAISNSLQTMQIAQAPRPSQAPAAPAAPAASPVEQSDDASERRRTMEEALGRADAAAAATLAQTDSAHPGWKDTEALPLPDTCYAPTMPLELHDEERMFPPRRATGRSTVKQ